jgi:hypothetical protein
MRDDILDRTPVCPHPGGTREHAEWWEGYFKLTVPLRLERWRREDRAQRRRADANHGHDFATCDRRCRCGVLDFDYRRDVWDNRNPDDCPIVMGPIFFLDCYDWYDLWLYSDTPAKTFGPSLWLNVRWLQSKLAGEFPRLEIVVEPRGKDPVPDHLWPHPVRPHWLPASVPDRPDQPEARK